MTEHTEQTTPQPGPVPARIQLDDFIEAVTRGVTRALAAQDDVSGYLGLDPTGRPSTTTATTATRPPVNIVIGFAPFPFPPTHPAELVDGGGTSARGGVR